MIKKFIGYYKPYKKLFFFDMFCAVVIAAVDLALPQLLRFLNNILMAGDISNIVRTLLTLGALMLVLYIIRYGAQYFVTSWGHIMGARIESDMRQNLFYHFQRLSFSYYDKNNTGEMISRLINDLFDIAELAHHGPENLLLASLKIIGSFLLLMFINVPITLILLAITIVMAIFSLIKNKKMRQVFSQNRKKIASVNSQVQDSLLGIKVIKSFANEELENHKFDRRNDEFFRTKSDSYKTMGNFHAVNSFLQGMLYIAALVSGGFFVYTGSVKATDLAIYFLYIGIFISPIDMLINFTELFQRGFSGFRRYLELIETIPEITDTKTAKDIIVQNGKITYQNVNFSYTQDEPVLRDISFEIPQGKTVAFVGPSGGGKTTICSLLPRFYDIDSGKIAIDDIDIKDFTLKSLRHNIGIVQQDVYIFNGTIKDNIAYGDPKAADEQIVEAAKKANIHDFIMSLPEGYDTHVGERGARLSGGQKQRISIARVFLKNPKILILDEATSALDNESEKHIQEALEKLSQDRTTIVIAHRLSTIRNADYIYVIANGRIKEQGAHQELMRQKGLYAKYYNMQFEGIDDLEI
ncbi:MAG TPA: ABC transporter ATP-binding protein [Clostridiales bacterium]|nr:ABC transporter ATP-binding protein [Clostridiales bacterium]